MARNVLLTGVPRAGTTLACELLNTVPDTVALDEPMDVELLTGSPRRPGAYWQPADEPPDQSLICDGIERFLTDMRESIQTRKVAISHQVGGRVTGARISESPDDTGLRTALATRAEIRVDKPLSPDFTLVVKHPAAFAALLETLVGRFEVHAVIRNPLAVLSSWQTVPISVRDGHHPVAERIEPALGASLARIDDRLERQLHLLGWFFAKLEANLPDDRVIRYESLVESGGSALGAIAEQAADLSEPLESRNKSEIYDRDAMRTLGKRLLERDAPYWRFYPRAAVEALLG